MIRKIILSATLLTAANAAFAAAPPACKDPAYAARYTDLCETNVKAPPPPPKGGTTAPAPRPEPTSSSAPAPAAAPPPRPAPAAAPTPPPKPEAGSTAPTPRPAAPTAMGSDMETKSAPPSRPSM